jgi:hypothetical protein
MDDTIAFKFKVIDEKLNRMADAFDAEIRSAKIRLDVLSQAGEHIAKAQLEILDRVEALEAGVVKGATEKPQARVVLPGEPQQGPRETGEPTKLLQHLECVAEALKDIDWPAHSAAVTSAVELLRQPAHSAATTAPLPRLDRDVVAAGWRKIREERESATADGLSPVEPAPQAPQGVTVEELAFILSEAPIGEVGRAYWLLNHRRLGPLLRGEGAPAAVPVVLPDKPPALVHVNGGRIEDQAFRDGYLSGWLALYNDLARQQGGQADG